MQKWFIPIFHVFIQVQQTIGWNNYYAFVMNMHRSNCNILLWGRNIIGNALIFVMFWYLVNNHLVSAQQNCLAGSWKCKDGMQCIAETRVCDQESDCLDRSDEDPAVCAQWNCSAGHWKCAAGVQCIANDAICDGRSHCFDRSDEDINFCKGYKCLSGHIKCAESLQCIKKASVCDGLIDCQDGSDELCRDSCLKIPLSWKSIIRRCEEDPSVCIPVEQYCDGLPQCPDGSDEAQSGCTCEDWGLQSCQVNGLQMTTCLNTNWAPLNKSDLECQTFLNSREHLIGVQNITTGWYHVKATTICPRRPGPVLESKIAQGLIHILAISYTLILGPNVCYH